MTNLWIKKIALLLSTLIFCALVVLALEAATRFLMPGINFQDTERSLLREKAFGDTYGWQPNASGISFGKKISIDEFGFRKLNSPQSYTTSWLILGDSVTFGVGVETEDTYVQLLQDNLPSVKLWNTAVIGYDIKNYSDVLHLTVEERKIPALKKVILFLCLNDIDLGQSFEKDQSAGVIDSNFVQGFLSFLRRHSKLYMLAKNRLADRSKFYFLHDLQLYQDAGQDFTRSMEMLNEMHTFLDGSGIGFTVVILPYEYQLRTKAEDYRLPQKLLTAYFKENGIAYIDAYEYFEQTGGDERENFLYADFAHLSKKGHQVVFNLLRGKIKTE